MLILDEPEGALDGESLEKIHEILQELNAAGTTIIVVTHDFSAFAHEGKKILSLGKNIFFGTFEEFAMVKYD